MINEAVIIGNLTKDVDLRKTRDNKSTCSFTLAVQRNFKNAEGEYDSDFINCVAWQYSADYLANFAHKGDMVAVNGRIQTRSYQKDGNNIYVTEIICSDVSIVHSRPRAKEEPIEDPQAIENINIETDELPFY